MSDDRPDIHRVFRQAGPHPLVAAERTVAARSVSAGPGRSVCAAGVYLVLVQQRTAGRDAVKVTVLLADSGQTDPSGKTHVLGLGWTVTDGPTTQPLAVLVLVSFDDVREAAGSYDIVLRLVDADGKPFRTSDTGEPLVVKASVDVDRRVDEGIDSAVTAPFLVNIGPGLPLEPGRRYRWEAEVDGKAAHRADVSFVTRQA